MVALTRSLPDIRLTEVLSQSYQLASCVVPNEGKAALLARLRTQEVMNCRSCFHVYYFSKVLTELSASCPSSKFPTSERHHYLKKKKYIYRRQTYVQIYFVEEQSFQREGR